MIINPTRFFDGYRRNFGPLHQREVDGLNYLLAAYTAEPLWSDVRNVAYSLATIKRETGIAIKVNGVKIPQTFNPIEEVGGRIYLSKYYLSPNLRRNLGNTQLSDAWNFKGRGYVQITGRANYTKFAGLLGLPLIVQPELALLPATSFQIMTLGMHRGLFTSRKLADYINDRETSYFYARKIINGLDHAGEIAQNAVKFERILRESTA